MHLEVHNVCSECCPCTRTSDNRIAQHETSQQKDNRSTRPRGGEKKTLTTAVYWGGAGRGDSTMQFVTCQYW
jgi:hypothetical protein